MKPVGRFLSALAILSLAGAVGAPRRGLVYANNVTFVIQTDPVSVPEGSTATVNVKLSGAPKKNVTATAIMQGSSDPDLTVTAGGTLTFTTTDWGSWHPVTVAAAEDADLVNGSRILRLHKTATNTDTVPDRDVTTNEADDDVALTFSAAPSMYGSTTPSGTVVVDQGNMPLAISTTRSTNNALTLTRVTIDNGTPATQAYGSTAAVTLPDADGLYRVKVEVKDDTNVWSDPAEVMIRLERGNPALVGTPEVFANDYGVVVVFQTNRPCYAELRSQSPSFTKTLPNGFPPQTSFALAVIRPDVSQNANLTMTIHLTDEENRTFDSGNITATVSGPSRTLTISPTGTDAPGGGTAVNPWRTLQYAGDRALPGDTVVLKAGLYAEAASLTHGGYDDTKRLVIQGEVPTTSIINGGKRLRELIKLTNAPYVTVRQLTYEFFQSSGIYASSSDHLTVEDCISYNGKGWVGGVHVITMESPYSLIQRNLAIGGDYGFIIGGDYVPQSSHDTSIKSNTVSQTTYAAVLWIYSAAGSVQTNNSFTYTGNNIYQVLEIAPATDLLTFTSDYNNIGTDTKTTFVEWGLDQDQTLPPDIWQFVQSEYFPPFPYGNTFYTRAKHLVVLSVYDNGTWTETTYWTLGGASGLRNMTHPLEVHSIFAEPLYENPNQPMASWDWRLKPASPNIGAGEGATNIGALGVGP